MKVGCHLFDGPVDIKLALSAVAGQEGNDGPEYDLMSEASMYIADLEEIIRELENAYKQTVENYNKC